ncbi:uncharacterized protein BDR25DRAFT_100983 [Lindgomyces ingoldianus]|uniref:Uncharacterized protein n=1 Tax=Lindgomyces ingoldianus TaxID=673940 RepID=A0ACB6RA49_9PLEO|nr:uncharacterized protein BDR25DRAFT_100983 [Lindgomyces ingoldianus]KAF2475220.1 hypothetical protein BDR25DRAFT_100983 [Lindgomyces ingoldianus]
MKRAVSLQSISIPFLPLALKSAHRQPTTIPPPRFPSHAEPHPIPNPPRSTSKSWPNSPRTHPCPIFQNLKQYPRIPQSRQQSSRKRLAIEPWSTNGAFTFAPFKYPPVCALTT